MDNNFQGSYQNVNFRDVDFQRLGQTIGTNIQKILQNVSSMQRMIVQIGTPQDNQQLQTQLRQIQHYTGQLAKDTSQHLKDLNSLSVAAAAPSAVGGISASEQRQWRLQKERLHNDFTKALNSFQAAQRASAQKEKEVVKKAKSFGSAQGIIGPEGVHNPQRQGNLLDLEDGNNSGGMSSGQGQQNKTQMLLEEEYNLEYLQEREKGIRQLESDIVDVNTIFKDLATMVHEQGGLVDSIEANVESTTVRVHEGTEQLRQAEIYKNKARRKKFILSVIGVIVLVIIIAIIAWQSN